MSAPLDHGAILNAREVLEILADLVAERLSARGITGPPPGHALPANGLLDVAEVAALLAKHPDTVRSMLRAGALPGVRVGRSWRVERQALERALARAQGADLEREEERRRVEAACERQRTRARAGRRARSLLG